jgi:hypothetical protein
LLSKHFWRLIGSTSFLMFVECFYTYFVTRLFLGKSISTE